MAMVALAAATTTATIALKHQNDSDTHIYTSISANESPRDYPLAEHMPHFGFLTQRMWVALVRALKNPQNKANLCQNEIHFYSPTSHLVLDKFGIHE